MTCLMQLDKGKVRGKTGNPCKAGAHCCSGQCKAGICAAGATCRSINRNGYCAIAGCLHAKTYTIRACDAGSTCHRLVRGGLCLKTCDLGKASTCRGHAKDKLGDHECQAWQNLAFFSGGTISDKPICEPGYLVTCDLLKGALTCASVGTWDGTTNDNKTNMACRDLTGKKLKDKVDPAGLCLDTTASGPAAQ